MNLSDVVKEGSGLDLLNLSRGQPEFYRDSPRKSTYPQRVARRIGITGFNGLYHELEQFLSTVLQLVVQTVHMANSDDWHDHTDQSDRAETYPASNVYSHATNSDMRLAPRS